MTAATVLKNLRKLADVDKDDVLGLIGLEERRTASDKLVPALALFGAGVLVGVGLGLMLAPKPGRELRADVKQRLQKGQPAASTNGDPAAATKTA
ncbi:MAG: YtxH domain-containing protein [Myxococcaceae bacterium]|nr:YtxH domain-containing protein [Myxococcaceae bacterium]